MGEARHQEGPLFSFHNLSQGLGTIKLVKEQLPDAILYRIVHDSFNIFIDVKVSMQERNGLHQ